MAWPDPMWSEDKELEHVLTLADPNSYYDFHDLLVIRDKRDGKLYGAKDSGCSCPVPFGNHTFPTDFTELRSASDLESLAKDGPWPKADVDEAIVKLGLRLN